MTNTVTCIDVKRTNFLSKIESEGVKDISPGRTTKASAWQPRNELRRTR